MPRYVPFILCHFQEKVMESKPDIFDFKWSKHVKDTLDHVGLSMWYTDYTRPAYLKEKNKLKMNDIFKQNWESKLMENSQCSFYRSASHRIPLAKFRMRTHHLPVNNGRFTKEQGSECHLCSKKKLEMKFITCITARTSINKGADICHRS